MKITEVLLVFGVIAYIILFLFLVSGLMTELPDTFEVNCLTFIFYWPYKLYGYIKDELNLAGIIILETIMIILTLPVSAVVIFAIAAYLLFWGIIKVFLFLFKKR